MSRKEDCRLYEKTSSDPDTPSEYAYGEKWVAMWLFNEGGYDTPEEARAAWERYKKSKEVEHGKH